MAPIPLEMDHGGQLCSLSLIPVPFPTAPSAWASFSASHPGQSSSLSLQERASSREPGQLRSPGCEGFPTPIPTHLTAQRKSVQGNLSCTSKSFNLCPFPNSNSKATSIFRYLLEQHFTSGAKIRNSVLLLLQQNDHKLSVFKQHKCIILQFWKSEIQNQF